MAASSLALGSRKVLGGRICRNEGASLGQLSGIPYRPIGATFLEAAASVRFERSDRERTSVSNGFLSKLHDGSCPIRQGGVAPANLRPCAAGKSHGCDMRAPLVGLRPELCRSRPRNLREEFAHIARASERIQAERFI